MQLIANGPRRTTIKLRDHVTAVRDTHTQGVPMLLLHSLGLDHRFWRALYPALASLGRVIAYDIRGHGRAQDAPLTVSVEQLAQDARELLDRLEIPQADVFGSSYGGAIAQHLALAAPERVRSLALIATATWFPKQELEQRAIDAEQRGMEAQISSSLFRWFLPETIALNPWEVRYARRRVRSASVPNWAAAWRALADFDVRDRTAAIHQPVLVLSGMQDKSATPDMMAQSAAAYKNAELRTLDPGTHMAVLEQPTAVAIELTAFRNSVANK
jgi:3-oxoadipate enol-lactonase